MEGPPSSAGRPSEGRPATVAAIVAVDAGPSTGQRPIAAGPAAQGVLVGPSLAGANLLTVIVPASLALRASQRGEATPVQDVTCLNPAAEAVGAQD